MISLIEAKHAEVRASIEAGKPGHAQGRIKGQLVSWHDGTFTANLTIGSDMDEDGVRCRLIDQWVRGEARATPGTFTRAQLLHRADQHEDGNGPGIEQGARDKVFADRIRIFAAAL
jgi:hypothetical protein